MASSTQSITSLFSTLQDSSGLGPSLDLVVFQSILLCLVASEKNLILRTSPEDIPLVSRVAILTLTSLFGIPSRHLKIKPRSRTQPNESLDQTHDSLLRSLLISPSDESGRHQKRPKRTTHSRSKSRAPYSRKSQATDVPVITDLQTAHPDFFQHPRRSTSEQTYSSPRPSSANIHPHAVFELPGALVCSGLENASISSQRSLDRAFAERKIVLSPDPDFPNDITNTFEDERNVLDGTWKFPSDFIAVYVCALDDRRRPQILPSLLDKFALGATVNLSPATRQVLEPLARSPSARPQPTSPLVSPTPLNTDQHPMPPVIRPSARRYSELVKSNPAFPPELLDLLRNTCNHVSLNPRLTLYLSDLFGAARHHYLLDGTRLTARAMRDATSLCRALRVLSPDVNEMEFIRSPSNEEIESSQSSQSHFTEEPSGLAGLEQAVNHSNDSDATLPFFKLKHVTSLEATDRNAAMIFPRVVSHRLALRVRPLDATLVSGWRGVVSDAEDDNETQESLKSVLVDIIKTV